MRPSVSYSGTVYFTFSLLFLPFFCFFRPFAPLPSIFWGTYFPFLSFLPSFLSSFLSFFLSFFLCFLSFFLPFPSFWHLFSFPLSLVFLFPFCPCFFCLQYILWCFLSVSAFFFIFPFFFEKKSFFFLLLLKKLLSLHPLSSCSGR